MSGAAGLRRPRSQLTVKAAHALLERRLSRRFSGIRASLIVSFFIYNSGNALVSIVLLLYAIDVINVPIKI